jgi:hypothetical protein
MRQLANPSNAFRSCLLLLPIAVLGCVTSPPAGPDAMGSAYAVGDRARVGFDEVVVSLPYRGASAPYQNLHVSVSAFVNPVRKTPSSEWDVEGILRRSEGRMQAQLSQLLAAQGEQSPATDLKLRELIRATVQPIVDAALKRWEHGDDWRAEVMVSSLYWTDASVGRAAQGRSWW